MPTLSRRPTFLAAQQRPWRPWVTYGALAAMAAVFVLQVVAQNVSEAWHDHLFVIDVDWLERPWSPFTSTLAHGDPFHLLFNGLFLFFIGPLVERLLRPSRTAALFAVGGALSGIAQVELELYVNGAANGALGASGALMALFGVLAVLLPREKMLFWGIVPVPMWALAIVYVLMDLAGATNTADGIGNFAHLSGLALGLGYGVWVRWDLKRRGLRIASRPRSSEWEQP